ncbi:zinc finger protein 208-like [Eurosta solidaginis]|uniref:zinc finger protein 208-like n=1 Tax=Eurosta solidaginis TaxID=178769 RepID=UPI0035312A10
MDTSGRYIDYLCRTCMIRLEAFTSEGSTEPQHQSVFETMEECDELRIADLLSSTIPQIVEVQLSDELPKEICCKCLHQLISVYRFQKLCVQSDHKMREIVSKKLDDLNMSMMEAAIEVEVLPNDTDSYPLSSCQPKCTAQSSLLPETQTALEDRQQANESESAQRSTAEHLLKNDQLLDYCENSQDELNEFIKNDPIEDEENTEYSDTIQAQGELSEFIKNEPVEDDEENTEYSDTVHSTTFVAKEEFTTEEQKVTVPCKENLEDGKQLKHQGNELECDICGKCFSRKSYLRFHKRIHSGEKPYKCDICEMRFAHPSRVPVHMRTHTGEKPCKCKYCGSVFKQINVLHRHLRVHLGVNIHRCKFCPLAFPLASELRLHLTSHENEDAETLERNMTALKEEEAKLEQKLLESKPRRCKENLEDGKQLKHQGNELECDICGKCFSRKSYLRFHKRIHSGEKPYKCDICEMRFARAGHISAHMRTHTGEKPYKCKYCETDFGQINLLHRHLRVHLGVNIHRCKFCPLAFPLASELRLHLTSHENEDPETHERNMTALKEEEAKLEQKILESKPRRCKENLEDGKQLKQQGNEPECDICGKCFSQKSYLRYHKRIHSGEKPYKCDICEMRFAHPSRVPVHMRTHTGEKPCKCKYCGSVFKQINLLHRHLRMHLGVNIYRCKFCPLAFPVISELRLHLTSHKNEDPETRERNMTALKEEEAKLKQQILEGKLGGYKSIRNKNKQFPCEICGKYYETTWHLNRHKLIHSGEKPHKCEFCEKRFITDSTLSQHMRTHTGEKPYKCKYCKRCFTTTSALNTHLRAHHLGDNIHRCKFCPLAFRLASELRVHSTTHKDEDPETRERNMKALKKIEAKLKQQALKRKQRYFRVDPYSLHEELRVLLANLMKHLREIGFYATGTLRANRTENCPLKYVKMLKGEDRGYRGNKDTDSLFAFRRHVARTLLVTRGTAPHQIRKPATPLSTTRFDCLNHWIVPIDSERRRANKCEGKLKYKCLQYEYRFIHSFIPKSPFVFYSGVFIILTEADTLAQMDTSGLYIDYLCRTCMIKLDALTSEGSTEPQHQSIFETIEECDELRIADLLSSTIPQIVEVQLSDELPKKICCKCLHQLIILYRFQKLCVQSDHKMREMVSKKWDDLNMSMMETAVEDEVLPNDADSYPLSSCQPKCTPQNSLLPETETALEGRQEAIELESAQWSTAEHLLKNDQLLDFCENSQGELNEFIKNDPIEDEENTEYSDTIQAQGELSEFIKNEPVEDDEENTEYSDTVHSTTFVAKEEFTTEEQKVIVPYKNIRDKNEQYQYPCGVCGKNFKTTRDLKRHKLYHSDDKPHKCDLCEKRFIKAAFLNYHMRTHTGEKPYKCKYCERCFTTTSVLNTHLRVHHLGDNIHRCKFCPLAFRLFSELRFHSTTHKDEDPDTRERNMAALREEEAKLKVNRCDICGKRFKTKLLLKRHKRIHSDEKPHKCDFCEMRFVQAAYLNQHMRTHTGEKPYKCKYCDRCFTTKKLLHKHLRIHMGDNTYRCKFCPLAFRVASELRIHSTTHKDEDQEMRERNMKALMEIEAKLKQQTLKRCKENLEDGKQLKHQGNELECDICGKCFSQKSYLRHHKRLHSGEKPYKCDICEKRFARVSYVHTHMRTHIHLGVNIYRCKFCPLAFPVASELRLHLTSHKNEDPETRERNMTALKEEEAKLKQQILEAKLGGCKENLENGKQLKHQGNEFECDICGKCFSQKSYLRHHKRLHSGEKPYKCDICEKRFARASYVHTHMRTYIHLGGVNIYRCKFCPLAFPLASDLRLHLTSHKNEDPETRERNMTALKEEEAKLKQQPLEGKPGGYKNIRDKNEQYQYPCDVCGKHFITKVVLKRHKRIHSGEKPHKCDFCEKRFLRSETLTRHIRTHTGEKPYKCKYCERCFMIKHHLNTHLRVHLGDNIHRCKFCPLAFRFASELRLHSTTHKDEDPETRERNIKALMEIEAKLNQQVLKMKVLT